MRAWSWAAAGALLVVTTVSCLDRSPSHRANAQPKAAAAAEQPAGPPEHAAPAPAAAPSAGAEAGAEETTHEVFLEHADRARYDNKTKEYSLTGDVVLRHEDGVLRAQSVRMNSETKKGVATGDLSFADKQTTLTANRLEIDFDARIGVFKGDVRMVTQKKPEQAEAKAEGAKAGAAAAPAAEAKSEAARPAADATKEPAPKGKGDEEKPFREYWKDRTEIRCPELEYSYREHRAVAHGGVTARQKDRTGHADEAVYTDKDEMLVLTGNVETKDERGETFRANKITISVKDDWLEAEGAIGSRFLVEEEKGKAGAEKGAPGGEKGKTGATGGEKGKTGAAAPAPAGTAEKAKAAP